MLYNIKTGYQGVEQIPMRDIVILVSSLRRVAEYGIGFVFTDRHAYLQTATFSSDLATLVGLDWESWRARDFKRKPEDPSKMERYQAEALIHHHLPVEGLTGLACYGEAQQEALEADCARRDVGLRVVARPGWYP